MRLKNNRSCLKYQTIAGYESCFHGDHWSYISKLRSVMMHAEVITFWLKMAKNSERKKEGKEFYLSV